MYAPYENVHHHNVPTYYCILYIVIVIHVHVRLFTVLNIYNRTSWTKQIVNSCCTNSYSYSYSVTYTWADF